MCMQCFFRRQTAYLKLYDLELIAGQNLLPSDTVNSFVINESAVKTFGFQSPGICKKSKYHKIYEFII